MVLDPAQAGFRLLHLPDNFLSDWLSLTSQMNCLLLLPPLGCRWSEMDVQPRMLLDLAQAGFRLLHMLKGFFSDLLSVTSTINCLLLRPLLCTAGLQMV
jgi:hypothetical protein